MNLSPMQLASVSGEYEVYRTGTTAEQLKTAIYSMTQNQYFDSLLLVSDNDTVTPNTSATIMRPDDGRAIVRKYTAIYYPYNTTYAGVTYTAFLNTSTDAFTYTVSHTYRSNSTTTDTNPTITAWTLYRRKVGILDGETPEPSVSYRDYSIANKAEITVARYGKLRVCFGYFMEPVNEVVTTFDAMDIPELTLRFAYGYSTNVGLGFLYGDNNPATKGNFLTYTALNARPLQFNFSYFVK